MAGNPVASINAQLGIDSTQFDSGLAKAPAKAKKAAADIKGAFDGVNFGEALDKIFDSSRLAVLDEGAAKIKVFGSALEPLGPYGIAAAAGIAAIGAALEQVEKTAEWAADIEKTSKALGVSTTYLQQFDYAAVSTGVGIDKGRAALTDFNAELGKYSAGQAQGRVAKFFDALGFTPEGIRDTSDTTAALEKVMLAIAKVPNSAQRAGMASATGLSAFLPVINEGTEGVEAFIGKMKEATDSDGVVSSEQIARAAELEDHIDSLKYLIGQHLRQAFIDLVPVIDDALVVAEKLAKVLGDIPALLKGLHRATHPGEEQLINYKPGKTAVESTINAGRATSVEDLEDQLMSGDYHGVNDMMGTHLGEHNARGKDYSTPAKPKADTTLEEDAKAQNDLSEARKQLTEAVKADATALRSHTEAATAEGQLQEKLEAAQNVETATDNEIQSDLSQRLAKLAQDEAKIRASTTDRHKDQQLALIEETRQTLLAAAARKVITAEDEHTWADEKAAREALIAQIDEAYQMQKKVFDLQAQIDRINAGYAESTDAKRASDLATLAHEKAAKDLDRQAALDKSLAAIKDAPDYDQQAAKLKSNAALDQNYQDHLYDMNVARAKYDDASPLAKWVRDATMDAGKVHDALETEAVKAFDDFNDGVSDAIVNGKSLGDVMHSVFATMEQDAIKYLLRQAEIGVLGSGGGGIFGTALSAVGGLFGIGGVAEAATASTIGSLSLKGGGGLAAITGDKHDAMGTSDASAGLTLVGERGPELLNIPSGAQVIPNDLLGGLSRSPLSADDDAGPSGLRVEIVDTTGLFETKVKSIAKPMADAAERRATVNGGNRGAALARAGAPARMRSMDLLGT